MSGKGIRDALEEFCQRQDVKACTHGLNRRHLEDFLAHSKIQTVEQLSESLVHSWLAALKARGYNPGGQSLALRVLRTFCRFCRKRRWTAYYPFEDFKIPKSTFSGRYLTDDERTASSQSIPATKSTASEPSAHVRALLASSNQPSVSRRLGAFPGAGPTLGSRHQGAGGPLDHATPEGARGDGRAESSRATSSIDGKRFEQFREAVYKKAKREKLYGVRFHETKHTGISALLEAGYSLPEVCRISGNSMRTISHYAHVNEQRVFEKWKSFEYGRAGDATPNSYSRYTAGIGETGAKSGARAVTKEHQGENAKRI